MFSGIVEELGIVKRISPTGNVTLLEISVIKVLEGLKIGDSILVNGVCLTAVKVSKDRVSFEAVPNTFKVTNLRYLRIGEKVNLERSLKVGERISGHFVSGHIDCIGIIRRKSILCGNLVFEISIPPQYIKYCLSKGSVAVDGISLTIQEIKSNSLNVYVIPHTLKETTLSFKGPSSRVNVEFDMLAKGQAASYVNF
ncbi:MAG: riboflavin synthase [Candidatus Omnitrophica bacterium]|jgi:riboflavin synthase|nr:riboflavin synthase [Candidatus Omnitrophota bacterium]MDD3987385.1 riboflavin synthase [Candidatus Omnitrophota bacterium]MDD5664628.1 riboflavin synthase [Candidatus Omnitrophota bacterium]